MISLEKAKEMLEHQGGVENIEVCKDEWVLARFANRLNPEKPHNLVVHPIREQLIMKIRVPAISTIKHNTEFTRVLANVNYDLVLGKAGVDSRDGEVMFEINHPCQDGDAEDPGPEVFARLVEAAMETARDVTLLATHVGMVEAGVPEEVVKRFLKQFQDEDEDEAEETDTL